jgi:flagellar hook-associated protein 2
MASPITFGGLASGLDTKAIIAALVAVEGRKVDFLKSSKSAYQKKVGALDELGTKLSKLKDALEKLADRDLFVARKSSLSDGGEDVLSASVQGDAAVGTYSIAVTGLAQSSFLRSAGQADANASLGLGGSFSIQVGSTTTNVTIDSSNDSLNGMRDAINDADAEVQASVVFDGTDYHLELRGRETGLANAVTLLAEPQGGSGPVLNVAQVRAAADAQFSIDGQAYTSPTNNVTGAIQGVTLQLLDDQAVGAAPVQLTVVDDFEGVKEQLQGFVDAYNDVIKFMNDQQRARSSGDEGVKPLAGESTLRSIRNAFTSILATQIAGAEYYPSLGTLGIKTTSDGTLKLDAVKLEEAVGEDLDEVVQMFTDATQGVGVKLLAAVEQRTDSVDGILKLRKDAFQETMRSLDRRIARAEDSLEVFEASLVRRFSQYEQLIGSLQAQGQSLGTFGFGSQTR